MGQGFGRKMSNVFFLPKLTSSLTMTTKISYLAVILLLASFYNPTDSGAIELESHSFDALLASTELIFVNFYADWCRFSNMLAPIFDEAADKVNAEFPNRSKVVLGRVDCDKQSSISSRFQVTKYPTLKLIRNGVALKKEYRGARTPEAFLEYIKKQLENPIQEFKSLHELVDLDGKKRLFIGYLTNDQSKIYDSYRRVAMTLKDECKFHVGFGGASAQMHPPDHDIIVFRPDKSRSAEDDETFQGDSENYEELSAWIQARCVPPIREITFENAEELTEEGLPFLILFHLPDDTDSVKRFNTLVLTQLKSEKQSMNFLTADGLKFAHPLHHLGKSEKDLPLIAIDSFRHMYLFPDANEMEQPGRIKRFIADLHSGKLHREFHYGPDPTNNQDGDDNQVLPTNPPESTFVHLGPSRNRYTLLKDEL